MSKKTVSRRDFLKMSALAGAGAALAACSPAATPTSAPAAPTQAQAEQPTVAAQPAAAGAVKLTFWTYPGDEGFLGDMTKMYQEKNPNVSFDIVKIELSDMTQKITTSLVAGSGLPDLADIEQGTYRKYCYGPGILDLKPFGADAHKGEIPDWCWNAGLSPNQSKILFLYYSVGIAVVHYRRSVFKAAGLPDDPDGVQALISKDWAAMLDAGDKISKPGGPWMFDTAKTVFGQYRDQFNPVWYNEDTKKFQINTPAMLDGLKLAADARKRGQDGKFDEWTPDWTNTFKKGTVATYPIGDWLPILLKDYGGDATKGDWGMVTCPGNTGASAGGSLFCAFEQSKNQKEAADLLQFLTFDLEAQMKLIEYYNFPALIKAWDDPRMKQPVEWYGGQPTRLVSAAGAKKLSDRKYTPYDDQCSTIMSTEVTNVLDQGKDPQKALEDAQATAESQIEIKS
jgi:cellobiose transport system substrate-binding protein